MTEDHPHLAAAAAAGQSQLITIVMFVGGVLLAAASTKMAPHVRVPSVLLLLGAGMLARAVCRPYVNPMTLARMAKPVSDMSLSLVGLVIGSHLNREALSSLGIRTMWYLVFLFGITFAVVDVTASKMFPQLRGYAPFVASIALERSSPEALAGITATKSRGPLSTGTMLTSAVMDCIAIVAFVVCQASLAGTGSASTFLMMLLVGTLGATGLALTAVEVLQRVVKYPAVAALGAAVLLSLLHAVMEYELLLSAIIAGAVLNHRSLHPMTEILEENTTPVHVFLFAQAGMRIDVVGMARHLSLFHVLFLYAARLAALCGGGYVACRALSLPHPQWRGLALVTQLAIALSLVTRMHDAFPEAVPLADAAAGSVLLNLVTGPVLLVTALRRSGEAASDAASSGAKDATASEDRAHAV